MIEEGIEIQWMERKYVEKILDAEAHFEREGHSDLMVS